MVVDYWKGNLYYFFTIHDETHESYSEFMYIFPYFVQEKCLGMVMSVPDKGKSS